jgi:spermidine synthase
MMHRPLVLFLNVFVVATCGLIHELLAGTLASYVLGDSVTQFSIIIGVYLTALGIGAWLSRFFSTGLAQRFIDVELAVALLGGGSAPLLFLGFSRLSNFHLLLYGVVTAIGILVGLELPLLMRMARDELDFKELVSRVLTFDYIGALAASLLFPLFCVPRLGLVRTSLLFGMLNAGVALWGTWLWQPLLHRHTAGLRARACLVLVLLLVGFIKADRLTSLAEESVFAEPIVYTRTTPYQRIVVTHGHSGFQLFLNGHLQFSSTDEYRYHEALVHPSLALARSPRRVLILGGGDGLALREVLKYPSIATVTLVDIDPEMTQLSQRFPPLAELNGHAFDDPRVEVINQDAFVWLENQGAPFDAVIIDFPDPDNFSLGKLYTTLFYRRLRQRLSPEATVGIQCTSPLVARQSFWCIIRTLEAAGFVVRPYQAAVPSFGVWGFALARRTPFDVPHVVPDGLRFLTATMLASLFTLPADLCPVPVEVNRLDNQVLVRYHETEWKRWD